MEFKDWFFRQFPEFYQTSDTYKDINGEGLFQRYLRGYGLELDEEIMPYMRNFIDIIDVSKCDEKFLPLIATILGSPPSVSTDPDDYRKVLAYALAIYKVKGTKRAYQILLGILGLNITVVELVPKRKITYDMPGIKYDAGHVYDSVCENCSGYYIGYSLPDNAEVDPALLTQASNVICFLQPINAKFLGFVKTALFTDTYNETITDSFTPQIT